MLMAPLAPAGTIAAFATTLPSNEFNVDTSGRAKPAGHADRKDSAPSGTAVTFSEYAAAVAEIAWARASCHTRESPRAVNLVHAVAGAEVHVAETIHRDSGH